MAANNQNKNKWDIERLLVFIFPFLAVTILFVIIWLIDHADISFYGLKVAWLELMPFDNRAFPLVHQVRNELAQLAQYPEKLSFGELWHAINLSGYFYVVLPIVLCIRAIIISYKTTRAKTRRVITVDNLPHIMSSHCPAIIPVLYYGDLMNNNIEGHESRQSPVEFVIEHNLVKDGELDKKRTEEFFIAQLGERITSINDLKIHEKAIFCILAYRVLVDASEYKKAQDLLDELNRSCHKGTWKGKPGYPIFKCIDQHFERFANHPDVTDLLCTHPYSRTLLQSMHIQAISRGKLPSTNFRWLKAMDRPLWYALNGSGRKSACIESCAIFTQRQWEEYAQQNDRIIDRPATYLAVEALENYLRENRIIK